MYISRPKYRHWRCMQNPNLLTAVACNLLWKIIWQLQMSVYTQSKSNIHRLVDLLSYQSYPKRAKVKKKKTVEKSYGWQLRSWIALMNEIEFDHKKHLQNQTQIYVNMIIWQSITSCLFQSSIKIMRPCSAQIWSVWYCRNYAIW